MDTKYGPRPGLTVQDERATYLYRRICGNVDAYYANERDYAEFTRIARSLWDAAIAEGLEDAVLALWRDANAQAARS